MYYPVNAPIGANVFYCREPVDGGGFVYYPVEMEDPGRLVLASIHLTKTTYNANLSGCLAFRSRDRA
eukprot:m.268459 g.268459  ORF g.268459 m.268459 type:complete len:67 (-) comp16255_c2_seq11:44-244(-)